MSIRDDFLSNTLFKVFFLDPESKFSFAVSTLVCGWTRTFGTSFIAFVAFVSCSISFFWIESITTTGQTVSFFKVVGDKTDWTISFFTGGALITVRLARVIINSVTIESTWTFFTSMIISSWNFVHVVTVTHIRSEINFPANWIISSAIVAIGLVTSVL